jgi:hypothetical protein
MLGFTVDLQPGLFVALGLTIILLLVMFRPIQIQSSSGWWDFGPAIEGLFRVFYVIPLLLVWLVYFIVN